MTDSGAERRGWPRQAPAMTAETGLTTGNAIRATRFFIFFGHNPLKSPDSQKLMKENESHFPFMSFHVLSFPFLSFSRECLVAAVKRRKETGSQPTEILMGAKLK